MIYFNEDGNLVESRVVSKNDYKIQEYIEGIDISCLQNYRLFNEVVLDELYFEGDELPNIQIAEDIGKCYGYYFKNQNKGVRAEELKIKTYKGIRAEFKLKKYNTLQLLKEALLKYEDEICAKNIVLGNFFRDVDKDLKKIESIKETPYFIDFLKEMYTDYEAFLEVFSYIDFEPIASYKLNELEQLVQLEDKLYQDDRVKKSTARNILANSSTAKTNSKILTKTRQFLTKIDK